MQCPLCADEALEPHFRLGIEIDVCPRCRGVWLDRGELDRLAADPPARPTPPPPAPVAPASWEQRHDGVDDRRGPAPQSRQPDRDRDRDRDDDRDRDQRSSAKKKKKKRRKPKSKRLSDALEDLFDDILDF